VLVKLLGGNRKDNFCARIARQSRLILHETVVEQDRKAIALEFP
jgi:hypothetical protein